MKPLRLTVFLVFGLSSSLRADEARFFRISGPVSTRITGFTVAGDLTWTNPPTSATFTVQAASTLTPVNWVDYIQVPATNSVTTHRLFDPNPPAGTTLIPAGTFTMGNCMSSSEGLPIELPLHTVYVGAFYMDKYEVSKALWAEVHQWATNHGYSFVFAGSGKATNHPVHSIRWYDIAKWCNARSEKEGLVPAYYTSAAQTNVYRSHPALDLENTWVKWDAGYRLPTEAEWEKAARGGASLHRFPWADTDNLTHSRANYYSTNNYAYDTSPTRGYHPAFNDNVYPFTSPVGYFAPNGYGLYDMAGNVWEWCWDWYSSATYNAPGVQYDPRGPSGSGFDRVMRGGSWSSYNYASRSAFRVYTSPVFTDEAYGFRCVRGH